MKGADSARVPALDGLRGLAVAGVLLFHGGFGWAGGGFLGVSIFFTLSGFLITSLLLHEHERGRPGRRNRISLRRFWARRARRILPAALIALAFVALYGLTVADAAQARQLPGDGLSALTQVANWRFVLSNQSYAALFSAPSPVQHFWSLAIEEQFYLVFPPLLVATFTVTRGSRRALGILVGVLAVGSALLAAMLFTPGEDPSRSYYGTDTRAIELLVGVLLAIVLTGRERLAKRSVQIAAAVVGSVALVFLVGAWGVVGQGDTLLYRGGLPVHALLVAAVITALLVPGPVRAVLAAAPLRGLGLISYGVYLYHWPIFLWLTPERTGLDGVALFAQRMVLTIAVAIVSYLWIEQPIRHGRRITSWRPAVVIPAAVAAVALLFVSLPAPTRSTEIVFSAVRQPGAAAAGAKGGTLPVTGPPTRPGSVLAMTASAISAATGTAPTAPTTAPAPVAPPPPPPVQRVLVIGDSVAQTLGRGLERWGPRNGVTVVNAARFYCGIAVGGRIGFAYGKTLDICGQRQERWPAMIDELQPDLVVVLSTIWDVGGRQFDAWGPDFVESGDPRFDQFIVASWQRAADVPGARGARDAWLTAPCAADATVSEELSYANHHYLPELVRTRPVISVDLAGGVCPDGKFASRLGPIADARPDGMHFSDAGADWVASWLGPRLVDPWLRNPEVTSTRARRF